MGPGAPISRALVAGGKMDLKTEVKWGQRNREICKRQAKSTSEEQRETNCVSFLFLLDIITQIASRRISVPMSETLFSLLMLFNPSRVFGCEFLGAWRYRPSSSR